MDLKVGTLNVRIGHPAPEKFAERVAKIIVRDDLDLCYLQEARQVARRLHRYLPGYEVAFVNGSAMVRDNVIVTRLDVAGFNAPKRGTVWERAKRNRHKGPHPARRALRANLEGLRVSVLHGPPRPHGWPGRGRADRTYWAAVEADGRTWNAAGHLWLAGGDFNRKRGRMKPVAKRLGASLHIKGIDGFLAGPGVRVSGVKRRKLSGHFDHPLVTATATFTTEE